MSVEHGTSAGASPVDMLVNQILEGRGPEAARSAAARGALPLPRPVLVLLYLYLRQDPIETIRLDAERSLGAISEIGLNEILGDPSCSGRVLAHFASMAANDAAVAELIAFHPNVTDDTIGKLAAEGNAQIVDLVLTNQERLLASPVLFDRLSVNPALRADQRGRMLDILEQFFDEKAGGASAPASAEDDSALDDLAFERAARMLDVNVGELFSSSEILDGEEFATSDNAETRTAFQRILLLNTAQRAILAMKGGREERSILIRDTNKVVSLGVLKNGRVTELEIESIARMRNVNDEVLRQIGINRDWSKSYAVAHSLVKNPRTPPAISTNFVSRLTAKDLKMLGADKGVPEIIRKIAKRTLEMRTAKATSSFRKH